MKKIYHTTVRIETAGRMILENGVCRSPFVLIWENYSTKTKNRQEGGTDVQLLTAQNGPPGLIFRAGRCAYFIYLSAVKPYGSIAPRDSAT